MGGMDQCSWDGYRFRMNWDCDKLYRASRPNWHAVAYALKRMWFADAEIGPTFNAAINGGVLWKRFGATDTEEDRFPRRFGPTEVSSYNPVGRMDITALVMDEEFGETLLHRLMGLSGHGFILSKEEVYDMRYFNGVYEFQPPTGPRAIVIREPYLEITFAQGGAAGVVDMPKNLFELFADAKKVDSWVDAVMEEPVGSPTAVLLSAEEVGALNERFMVRPEWMPEWQYGRVRELLALERGAVLPFYHRLLPQFIIDRVYQRNHFAKAEDKKSAEEMEYEIYKTWVDWELSRAPRAWEGHLTGANNVSQWYTYRDAMPEPVKEAMFRSWNAWLMPDRKTAEPEARRRDFEDVSGDLVHPMVDDPRVGRSLASGKPAEWGQGDTYWLRTGDWRGNKSYFRSGFTRTMSTQNFNSSATAGALLNGQIIGSAFAMEDGRVGLMQFPFWLWTYSSGVPQEYVDHYYWAVSLAGNKNFPDYCEEPQDRMAGWSIIMKNMEDLSDAYHPNLKKLHGPTSRTFSEHVLGVQDGLYFVLHVLSPKGALMDMATGSLPILSNNPERPVKAWGGDYPPDLVALQSLSGPWADPWFAEMVDEKPLPWVSTVQKEGSWVTTFYGENYGMSSLGANVGGADRADKSQRFHAMGHWRRVAERPESMTEVGTMDMRMGFNQTRFGSDGSGWLTHQGRYRTSQYKNTIIMMGKPDMGAIRNAAKGKSEGNVTYPEQGITSVQASMALFNYEQPEPTWEIYVGERRITELPVAAKFGELITIKDGVTYMAVRPLGGGGSQNSELRTQNSEVMLLAGVAETQPYHTGFKIMPAMTINAYLYRSDEALPPEADEELAKRFAGFVVTFGDVAEYGSFEAFQAAMKAATLSVDGEAVTVKTTPPFGHPSAGGEFNDGDGDVAATINAAWDGFTVNGVSPMPERNIWKDSPLAQMGTGRLEKGGAVMEQVKGTKPLMLQTFPKQGITVAINPTPEYQEYTFKTADGVTISADGLLSMGRWVVHGKERVDVKYCAFEPVAEGCATAIFVAGMSGKPAVTLNGEDVSGRVTVTEGRWAIPLK